MTTVAQQRVRLERGSNVRRALAAVLDGTLAYGLAALTPWVSVVTDQEQTWEFQPPAWFLPVAATAFVV